MERIWRPGKSDADRAAFKTARNTFSSQLFNTRVDYHTNEIKAAAGNQKKLFAIISSLSCQSKENPLPPHTSIKDLANDFGNFFKAKIDRIRQELDTAPVDFESGANGTPSPTKSPMSKFAVLSQEEVKKLILGSKSATCDLDPIPTWLLKKCLDILLPVLTKMVNTSLQTGIFPEEWKTALVIPLIKKLGLDVLFPNYRPVSNLAFVSKLTERAVVVQSTNHTAVNCPLPVCTSAYRTGHSTESALLKVQSDILTSMENQEVTLLVLIDLSAAFDTIDSAILLDVLESRFGISDTALKWFESYLTDRSQRVNIGGVLSDLFNLEYGVPQGSCLGPILFTHYASTLFDIIGKHLCKAHGYADDHSVYLSFKPYSHYHQDNALSAMEDCLRDIKGWMVENKLKMNDSKTEFIVIGSAQQLKKIQYDFIMVGDISVKAVDSVRNLGAYFDSTLSMVKHIDTKCTAASIHLYRIRKIRKFLTREATEILTHAFIFSHLDYCNGLLFGLPDNQIVKMQRIQNIAARLVFQQPKFSHVTPLFIELHWLPIRQRITFKVLLFTFKAIHCQDKSPKYINEMFIVKRSSQYSTRSVHAALTLQVPRTKLATFQARSLPVAGATEWNKLPSNIRKITKLDDFKTALKTHLFRIAYNV